MAGTSTLNALATPMKGDTVQTTSGVRLGRVRVTGPADFQVVIGRRARWLSRDAIFTAYNGCVTLVCEADGLWRYTTAG